MPLGIPAARSRPAAGVILATRCRSRGACAPVRHLSWPDITPGRQVAGVPIGIPAARLSDGLLCEAIPVEDHYWPSRGAFWVPFFTHLCPCSMATCASMAGWGLPSCSSMHRASSYVVLLRGLLLPCRCPFSPSFACARWQCVLVWLAGAYLHARRCAGLHPLLL